jgi:hypothetical protein
MMRAYFRLARVESSRDLAPVTTIRPLPNTSAVVLGSRSRIITAANRLGRYSVFRPFQAICLRSSMQLRFTVDTMFWILGSQYLGISISLSPFSGLFSIISQYIINLGLTDQSQSSALSSNSHWRQVTGAVGMPFRFISFSWTTILLRTSSFSTSGFHSRSAKLQVLAHILVWWVYLLDSSLHRQTSAPSTLKLLAYFSSCFLRVGAEKSYKSLQVWYLP